MVDPLSQDNGSDSHSLPAQSPYSDRRCQAKPQTALCWEELLCLDPGSSTVAKTTAIESFDPGSHSFRKIFDEMLTAKLPLFTSSTRVLPNWQPKSHDVNLVPGKESSLEC